MQNVYYNTYVCKNSGPSAAHIYISVKTYNEWRA